MEPLAEKALALLAGNSPALLVLFILWHLKLMMVQITSRIVCLENRVEKLIRKHVLHHSKDAAHVLNDKVGPDDE